MRKINELISDEITERISEKLNEIEKSSNLSNLDVSSILNKIRVLTSKNYVTIQNDLWKDISKLSVDFYIDFEYYKQFSFQSKFSCKEYHDALKSLGFKEINGFWKSYCKPSKTLVINYIVQSCIYRTIMMKMNEGDSAVANLYEIGTKSETSECLDFYPFCDKYLNNVGGNCEACCATAEEIENLKNQFKLIKNKNDDSDNDSSVAASIEFVENDIGGLNVEGKMNSVVCMEARTKLVCKNQKTTNVKISSKLSKISKDTRENTSNNIENSEKIGTSESWTCWFWKCSRRNGGNEQFCTDCGIDKSASGERGAAVDMRKYGETKQVWICHACGHINDDLTRSLCCNCFEYKFDVKGGNKMVDGFVEVSSDKEDEMGIPGDNGANKWECDKCKSVNAGEILSCTHYQSPNMEKLTCKQCTMRNRISKDHCGACRNVNENRIIKYCLECRNCEIICDNLCGDCLTARNESWTCWYRLCGNKNPGNETYCKHCGLDRYADKIKIGTPVMRCKGDVPVQIWICDQCYLINDISHYCCQNPSCLGTNKYGKQCRKCDYKYNYESSNHCEICKERIN